jgi:hypothetical protein
MLTQLVCKHSQTKNAHVGSLGRVVGDVQHRQQHTVRRSGIICCGVADNLTVRVSRRRRARRAAGCKAARRVSGMRPGGWHAGQQSARGSTHAATLIAGNAPQEGLPRERRAREQARRRSAHVREERVVLAAQVVAHKRHAARQLCAAQQLAALRFRPQQRHVKRGGKAASVRHVRCRQRRAGGARCSQVGAQHAASAHAAPLLLVLFVRGLLVAVAGSAARLLLARVLRRAALHGFAAALAGRRSLLSFLPRPPRLALRPLRAPVRRCVAGVADFAGVLVPHHIKLRSNSCADA